MTDLQDLPMPDIWVERLLVAAAILSIANQQAAPALAATSRACKATGTKLIRSKNALSVLFQKKANAAAATRAANVGA